MRNRRRRSDEELAAAETYEPALDEAPAQAAVPATPDPLFAEPAFASLAAAPAPVVAPAPPRRGSGRRLALPHPPHPRRPSFYPRAPKPSRLDPAPTPRRAATSRPRARGRPRTTPRCRSRNASSAPNSSTSASNWSRRAWRFRWRPMPDFRTQSKRRSRRRPRPASRDLDRKTPNDEAPLPIRAAASRALSRFICDCSVL